MVSVTSFDSSVPPPPAAVGPLAISCSGATAAAVVVSATSSLPLSSSPPFSSSPPLLNLPSSFPHSPAGFATYSPKSAISQLPSNQIHDVLHLFHHLMSPPLFFSSKDVSALLTGSDCSLSTGGGATGLSSTIAPLGTQAITSFILPSTTTATTSHLLHSNPNTLFKYLSFLERSNPNLNFKNGKFPTNPNFSFQNISGAATPLYLPPPAASFISNLATIVVSQPPPFAAYISVAHHHMALHHSLLPPPMGQPPLPAAAPSLPVATSWSRAAITRCCLSLFHYSSFLSYFSYLYSKPHKPHLYKT